MLGMRAAVVSIGSELLGGFLTDTNATFLAQEMTGLGVELVGVAQVGDDLGRIVKALERAWEDADIIVTTGGIGPTEDDLTREAIARLLGEQTTVDPDLLRGIQAYFASRGMAMPEQNAKQAWLISSAEPLPNPLGTAPGWFTRKADHVIVTMPGVPREMTRMWREQAVPRLLPLLGDRFVVSRTLKTIGIGESAAERLIADLVRRGDPVVATYAKDDGVHIRITKTADDRAEAEEAVARAEREIQRILGPYIYGADDVSLGEAILTPLAEADRTLATSEAGGGGRLAALLEEEPLAVAHLHGSLVRPYERAAAERGIDPASPERVAEVAAGEADEVRTTLEADYGMAVAVHLAPGPTPDQTRGSIALCVSRGSERWERAHEIVAVPSEVRRRAGLWAAEFLRTTLIADLADRG